MGDAKEVSEPTLFEVFELILGRLLGQHSGVGGGRIGQIQ